MLAFSGRFISQPFSRDPDIFDGIKLVITIECDGESNLVQINGVAYRALNKRHIQHIRICDAHRKSQRWRKTEGTTNKMKKTFKQDVHFFRQNFKHIRIEYRNWFNSWNEFLQSPVCIYEKKKDFVCWTEPIEDLTRSN